MTKDKIFIEAKNMMKESIREEEKNLKYISNMANWLCVHVTNYMPQQNLQGNYFIQTTAMATNNEIARATVHVTLNQIVSSHMSGNWDSAPFVILSPYNDIVKKNGNPSMLASEDTYFIPNPDTGLILPKTTCIVKPDNSTLFNIGKHISTYKTDDYTEQEIQTILSFTDIVSAGWMLREKYDEYNRGEISEAELFNIFFFDKTLKQKYEQEKDKKVVLLEICEQRKKELLTMCLRDAVVVMTMQNMGYKHVISHENDLSKQFAETAKTANIPSNSGKQAHSGSLEKALEANSKWLSDTLPILKTANFDDIYKSVTFTGGSFGGGYPALVNKFIRKNILKDNPSGFYDMYVETFNFWNRDIEKKYTSIKNYNPYLDIVIRRNVEKMDNLYTKVINNLKQNPKFAKFKSKLQFFHTGENMKNGDYSELELSDEMLQFLNSSKQKI